MKVYILTEYDTESSETIGVFDSLEKAQSYRDGQPKAWTTDKAAHGWWERILVETGFGTSINIHLGISEWEVK